jgi:hypothetical protein
MYPIKQSTAITVPFFVHDVSGDAVTGLVDAGFTKRISKNGGAFAAMTVTITEMENGFYSFPLSASHSDTNGILTILFTHASAKQINLQYRVSARLPDDLAFPTVSGRSTDVLATGEVPIDFDTSIGTLAAAQIEASALDGKGDWNIGKTGYTAGPTAASFTAAAFAAGAIDANALATDAVNEIVDQVWNELQADHVTVGSFGEIAAEIALILADTNELQTDDVPGLIAALNDLSAANVNAEVVDALNVDTYVEPGQGAPLATTTLAAKINYLYKAWRNKSDQDATTYQLYNDAGAVVDQKATVSDDATTATKGLVGTGP